MKKFCLHIGIREVLLVLALTLTFTAIKSTVRAELSPDWISRVPLGTSLGAGPAGIHVDPDGVSYVTGTAGSSSVNDIKTVSFAPDGASSPFLSA